MSQMAIQEGTHNRLSTAGLPKSCFSASMILSSFSLIIYASWSSWYLLYSIDLSLPLLNPLRRVSYFYCSFSIVLK